MQFDILYTTLDGLPDRGMTPVVVIDKAIIDSFAEIAGEIKKYPFVVLEGGEALKSWTTYKRVVELFSKRRCDRSACLVAIGGGALLDLCGFVAATYLRGIAYISFPTTLLAMADAAYGGKVGINLAQGKNLVGAFYPPLTVIALLEFLKKLPQREFNSGMAEVLKAAITRDKTLFANLEKWPALTYRDRERLGKAIHCAVEVKKAIVQEDPNETSDDPIKTRRTLNLGHTFGHALEKVAGYVIYQHGEAVALGIRLAARLSVDQGWIKPSVGTRIEALLDKYDLPKTLIAPLPAKSLVKAMHADKKAIGGVLHLVVIKGIASVSVVEWKDEQKLVALWKGIGAV